MKAKALSEFVERNGADERDHPNCRNCRKSLRGKRCGGGRGGTFRINQANKLSRSFATLLGALNRHRGKGQQKVTVEHVHVHSGGQAIVGAVAPGGGIAAKDEEQPHAKQLAYAPEPPLPSERDA